MSEIKNIQARYILDSRGNPTVEADVILSNGIIGRAAAPSGASTGDKEALELRDQSTYWCGKGVNQAISNIHNYIKPALIGLAISDILKIDSIMLDLDGFVAETNATNIFMIKNGVVYTPFTKACLPGITRGLIIQLCQDNNIPVFEKDISVTELYNADEVFTTGTMGELARVEEIDKRKITGNANMLSRLKELFKHLTITKGELLPF